VKRTIRLRGIDGPYKGQLTEHEELIRVGRLTSLELPLDDSSVSRRHAELRLDNGVWQLRDLQSTNGSYVNGNRVGPNPATVKARDIVQFGKVAFLVEIAETPIDGPSSDQLIISAYTNSTYEDGLRRMVFDKREMPRAGEQLFALLRAGHHLVHIESEDELLDSVLHDAVSVLDAQRGAIVLAEDSETEPKLKLKKMALGKGEQSGRFHFSKRLTHRCFNQGESLLYGNMSSEYEVKLAQSIAEGGMHSVMVVLLRTPRRKLGVLHLDRGPLQNPFTEDDLLLADALAAHVSAGIESAQLLNQQRDLFVRTVSVLAEMVELRDKYTGGHTQRVTKYATLLAEKMELPRDQLELIKLGTPLHDIGKIGIRDAILQKPGRLTAAEFAEMQTHTVLGAEYLGGIPELVTIIPIVRSHHERWDGTGYPDRLNRTDIPLLARIVAVADAFDAMTSSRPYHENKKSRSPEYAFAEVERQAGRQFDPDCAAAFLAIREQIMMVKKAVLPGTGSHYALETQTPAPVGEDANKLPETHYGLIQPRELKELLPKELSDVN
jgi:HD-GYP domain-containing protein (c-di-GMP phosphodiesterase class II)/pSer/pThr/pTyr-binding forkhead associated (FHA) protein